MAPEPDDTRRPGTPASPDGPAPADRAARSAPDDPAEPDAEAAQDAQDAQNAENAEDTQVAEDTQAVQAVQAAQGAHRVDDATAGRVRPPGQRRLTSAGAMIALLVGMLGFALVVQVRSNTTDSSLTAARTDDLVRILSDLDARQARLRQDVSSLEETQRELAAGAQGNEAALQQARRRADELGLLAGTLPATGPGLTVTFSSGKEPVRAATILDSVEELRGAGAEVMQIGDGRNTVRIVTSTYFVDNGDGIQVDGERLSGTYTLSVIGDPQTMRPALDIPGGVVDTVHQHGGNVIVRESGTVEVAALHRASPPRYARPVS